MDAKLHDRHALIDPGIGYRGLSTVHTRTFRQLELIAAQLWPTILLMSWKRIYVTVKKIFCLLWYWSELSSAIQLRFETVPACGYRMISCTCASIICAVYRQVLSVPILHIYSDIYSSHPTSECSLSYASSYLENMCIKQGRWHCCLWRYNAKHYRG